MFGGPSNRTYPSTTSPPRTPVPDIPPTTMENIVYVPKALEGQLTLQNLEFLDEYSNHESEMYKNLAQGVEREIREALQRTNPERGDVNVRVTNMKWDPQMFFPLIF